jgi:2-oxoglutarate ferredoxin oxidoreductase subunit alpha
MARNGVTLARAWAAPGTPGYEHRIGGLEKDYVSGQISSDPVNHQKMILTRAEKVQRIANDLPECSVEVGATTGKLLLIGWGSTYGAIREAVERVRSAGCAVSHLHLRSLHPFPRGLATLLAQFDTILLPELNSGQLCHLLRAEFMLPIRSLTKTQGKPFRTDEIVREIRALLEN